MRHAALKLRRRRWRKGGLGLGGLPDLPDGYAYVTRGGEIVCYNGEPVYALIPVGTNAITTEAGVTITTEDGYALELEL